MANKKITRNEFLRLSGCVAGAALLEACAPQTQNVQPTQAVQTIPPTQAGKANKNEPYPRVGLYLTQERSLSSSQTGREYKIAVWLPESYGSNRSKYPILYLLDSDLFFGVAANFTPLLNYLDNIPEIMVVGIGYQVARNFADVMQMRELDFKIPEVQSAPPNSHAELFLAALKQEIIPFVESNYRADPGKRLLYGYSSSGFFTLYTLFHEPDLFNGYIAGSGDTDLSAPYMPAHDQKLDSREKKDPIDLFLSIGSLEESSMQSSPASFNTLVEAIKAKNYPGLRLTTDIWEGEKHGAAGAALSYIKGLRHYFSEKK